LILGLIHKNLSCDISFFLDELELVLDKINNENKNKFMMGDFNMDLLNRANSSDFVNMMVSHDSFPLVTIPTRILHLLASLIDNFFVNGGLLERYQADVVVPNGSDHLLLISKIKLNQ
jgi:endonuclease/exonuclease/phosphatase (EEP) superfamily protein YafD